MTAAERHRLATRVARAARLAGSPIGYYHAHADTRVFDSVEEAETFYARYYGDPGGYHGDAWAASAPNPDNAIKEVSK